MTEQPAVTALDLHSAIEAPLDLLLEDLEQLFVCVVFEDELVWETNWHTRVVREDLLYLLLVPGQDEHEFSGQILRLVKECAKDLGPYCTGCRRQLVSFVNEDGAAAIIQNLFDDFYETPARLYSLGERLLSLPPHSPPRRL